MLLFHQEEAVFQRGLEGSSGCQSCNSQHQAVRMARSASTTKPRSVPVHQEEVEEDESSLDEEVERLSIYKTPQKGLLKIDGCASCGGPHPCQQCQFRDAQCQACGKMGHINRACLSKHQTPFPEQRTEKKNHLLTKDDLEHTQAHLVVDFE